MGAPLKLTRIILDASGDLAGQMRAAEFALRRERPSDGVMIVSRGDDHYGVRWNKGGSLRVYRGNTSDAPLSVSRQIPDDGGE